jgi:hypothetical protein
VRVHRSHPSSQYTVLPNSTLRDSRLSYEARGVLVELLSRPDDWSANADGLATLARSQRGHAGEGRQKMRRAFADLEAAGYMRRVRTRTPRGQMVTEIHVYDTSQTDDSTGGTSVRTAKTGRFAARTDVPRTGMSVDATSARSAKTGKSAARADVPRTGVSVGRTSKRSTENEVTEKGLSLSPGSLHAVLSGVVPDVTERETELALAEIQSRPGVVSAAAVLRAEIRDGGAPALIQQIRRISAAPTTLPPLCGQCDNRFVYDDEGRLVHCPRCHPAAQQLAREARAT